MAEIRLIWCADGNYSHSRIAIAAGWEYGVRLPAKGILRDVHLAFADQDWKKPDRAKYMEQLARHKPAMATVLDWEHPEQYSEVIRWAEEAALLVAEAVIVIPKVPGTVPDIPTEIKGREVRIGYSVPTSYGGSPLGLWELTGRTVHLLGGSPQKQVEIYSYLRGIADVRSADGNMAKRMATKRCCYWTRHTTAKGHWQTLHGYDGDNVTDACVKRSLEAIREYWRDWQ